MSNKDLLPVGWVVARLADVADHSLGKMLDRANQIVGKNYRYLRNINVRWGEVKLDDVLEMRFRENELERYSLRPGDLLICEGGEPGRCAIWDGAVAGMMYQKALHRVRPRQDVDAKIIAYQIKVEANNGRLARRFTGTTIKHFTGKALAKFEVKVPPVIEQRRIIAKIEALQARSQRARTALEAIPPLLEKFRQSVLAAAFRGDLTGDWRAENPDAVAAISLVEEAPVRPSRFNSRSKSIQPGDFALAVGNPEVPAPEGWDWVLLADIARLETGHTPSRKNPEYWGGNVPWLSIPDARVHHSRTIPDTSQHTNELGLANSAARLLPIGTVCLSRTASVGYVTVMGQPMATSQDFVDWVCTSAVNPHWLKWLLVAEKQALLRFGKGSTHKTIYFPEVLSFNVCLPPREEQDLIVQRIEERFALAQQLATVVDECTQHHSGLEPAILAKAFRGELVPQLEAEQQEAVA